MTNNENILSTSRYLCNIYPKTSTQEFHNQIKFLEDDFEKVHIFDLHRIVVTTDNINIEHDNQLYELGKFYISLNLLCLKSIKDLITCQNKSDHRSIVRLEIVSNRALLSINNCSDDTDLNLPCRTIDNSFIHPHVTSDRSCLGGDTYNCILNSIPSGEIQSIFLTIYNVLCNYNSSSYIYEIDHWNCSPKIHSV